MKVLVTGGAGFIGSHIVEALLNEGHEVRVLDSFSTGKKENLVPFLSQIELIYGDLRDFETVQEVVEGVDIAFHIAAIPSVIRSIEDPMTTNNVNVVGTLNLLEASRRAGVRRVVYASSSSVYGDTPRLPRREEDPPSPLSPYALQKLTSERYCNLYFHLYGLETVILRYFNIFGPRQDPGSIYSGVVSRFITSLINKEPPVIYGDGEQSRDFTFVENAVQATILAAVVPEAKGQTFNVATGKRYSVNHLWEVIRDLGGSRLKPQYTNPRPGDIRHSQADISRAKMTLGYEPKVDLEEGLRRTLVWYRQRKNFSQEYKKSSPVE